MSGWRSSGLVGRSASAAPMSAARRASCGKLIKAHSSCMTRLAPLPDRGVIAVEGEDRVAFLQGLVSNDVAGAVPGHAVWAALLTPQGKWLADFFILSDGERLLLDCERGQLPMLRSACRATGCDARVTLGAADGCCACCLGRARRTGGHRRAGPRLPDAGWRAVADAAPRTRARSDWDRTAWPGLPDGSRDLESGEDHAAGGRVRRVDGVSWTKGCYMGQELTARTKYRGLVKRRLVPVRIRGALPAPGTPMLRTATEVGAMRSGPDRLGLRCFGSKHCAAHCAATARR